MSDIQISPAPISEICRPVSREEFSPALEEDVIYFRPETRTSRPYARLLVDDLGSNIGLLPPAGVDKTFAAHFHNAFLVHDAMCIVATGDRVPLPETWNDYAMFHAVELYHHRAPRRAAYPVTWTEEVLHNGLEYYVKKSPNIYAKMINGAKEYTSVNNYRRGQTAGTPHLVISGPHVILSNISSTSYFHFIMDVLSRLWIFDEWPEFRQFPIIIPPFGDKLEQTLADIIGVPRSQLIVLSAGIAAHFTFKHLIFPSALHDRLLTAERLAFIRAKITGSPERPAAPPRRRVYLSRSDRPYKTVGNEAELQTALLDYGFESVLASELSVREQARLFAETELLVGAGGGGFANMMFMPPGAMVLELSQIAPPVLGRKRQIVMELANLCQLHHMVLTSRSDTHAMPRGVVDPSPECPTSMTYDVGRVRKAVENCLAMLQAQSRVNGTAASVP